MLYQRISVPSSLPFSLPLLSFQQDRSSSLPRSPLFLFFSFSFFSFFIYIIWIYKFQGFEQIGERWVKGELKVRQRGGKEKKKKETRGKEILFHVQRESFKCFISSVYTSFIRNFFFLSFSFFFENRKQNFQFVIRLRETPGFYLIRRSILHRIFFWYRLNTDRVALVAGSSSICNGVSCSIMFDKRMLP